jgi:hypothetical protein
MKFSYKAQHNKMSVIFSRRNHQYSSMRSDCSLHGNTKTPSLADPAPASKSSIVALRKIEAMNKDNLNSPRLCRRGGADQQQQSSTAKKLPLRSPLQSPQIIKSTRIMNGCKFHHSKSPGSSGTSVESIVPKYGGNTLFTQNSNKTQASTASYIGGAQKRAYNVNNTSNKLSNKVINTRQHNGIVPASPHPSSHHYHQARRAANVPTANGGGANNTINNNTTYNKNKENIIKENRIVPNTACRSSFSSKFPNGLPFEDEFYRRQPRPKSVSDTSRSPSDSSLVPFEDEFLRKPSNEALYVDFTKQIGGGTSKPTTNNYFDKFDKCAQKRSDGDEDEDDNNNDDDDDDDVNLSREKLCEQPVMYVAVASWVPNRLPYGTNIEEPTNEILE